MKSGIPIPTLRLTAGKQLTGSLNRFWAHWVNPIKIRMKTGSVAELQLPRPPQILSTGLIHAVEKLHGALYCCLHAPSTDTEWIKIAGSGRKSGS